MACIASPGFRGKKGMMDSCLHWVCHLEIQQILSKLLCRRVFRQRVLDRVRARKSARSMHTVRYV
ncbi:uncharacterized protein LY79DRAFT_553134 [Colletotrichum navitas]|uniref:Uncharacterized protein n=1 Tax=Colletotrichum navitas TaxID=681940 RepID=A0AAD8Q0H1_9PEZI|nr:uncharacterized protein LY79DRAFT_553134 [Colletotrichum navitas]KAK1593214.1 hypothetical protein LY79DRAFT_553134 [Colletotrichum navitas]